MKNRTNNGVVDKRLLKLAKGLSKREIRRMAAELTVMAADLHRLASAPVKSKPARGKLTDAEIRYCKLEGIEPKNFKRKEKSK